MPKSITEKKRSLNVMLGIKTEPARTGVYVGLLKSNPTASGSFASEANGSGYQRGQAQWSLLDDGTARNTNSVQIRNVPPGIYRYWAVFDAQANGHIVAYDALPWPLEIASIETITVAPSNLTITEL